MKPGTIFQIGDTEECESLGLPIEFAHKLAIVTSIRPNYTYQFNLIEPCKSHVSIESWYYWLSEYPLPNIVLDPKED